MKAAVCVILAICALVLAAYFASPVLAVHGFVAAARSGDADKLEEDVDFPAVRDSFKSQLNAALLANMRKDPGMKNNPFAVLGAIIAPAVVDRMVDAVVTPDGIAALVLKGKLNQDATTAKTPAVSLDYAYEYLSLDRFRVTLNGGEASSPVKLVFERRGFFAWKLIKIELPADALNDETSAASNTPAADDVNTANDQTSTSRFPMPSLPTPIEQMDCHMGECIWEQIESVSDVRQVGDGTLRVVRARSATTTTPDGQDYPDTLPPNAKVSWGDGTSWDFCSLSHPASIGWDSSSSSYLVTPLDIASPYGYEMSDVAEYKMVCHGLLPEETAYQHPEQLGYGNAGAAAEQFHAKSLDDALTGIGSVR